MEKLQDSLKSNPTFLRVCIQCEVMEKKPVWESYKRFCEKLGEDAMEYIDFEFWFMRFYNGETDLEYDRSKEPKKMTLKNLSEKLLGRIVEELNPFERILFRQVSPGTRSIVDELEPKFQSIDLIMHADRTPSTVKFGKFDEIKYYPLDQGYKMEYCGVDQIFEDGDYLDGMVYALESFFCSKNRSLKDLFVVIGAKTVEDWKKLIEKFSIGSQINIKSVDFIGKDTQETLTVFLSFLDLLKPGHLESIDLFLAPDSEVSFYEMAETEQWKKAKNAKIWTNGHLKSDQLQYFSHFEVFAVKIEDLTMGELVELRDTLIHPQKMQKLSESLKSSPIYLRTCIQYEVLDSISCWDSYKRFCKKLGDDVMEYIDFEFWFMRFYNGEADLEYDRSKEPKKRTFMDLPVKIFNKIADDLKPVDRILLRQTCPAIESLVDNLPQKFEKIVIGMEDRLSRTLILLGNQFVEYFPQPQGHFLKSNGIIHENYENDDLEGISYALESSFKSKNAKFEELKVTIEQGRVEDFKILMEKLRKSTKINVNSLNFSAIGSGESLNLLRSLIQIMEPGDLEYIRISNAHGHVEYDELAETEQWKRAKTVKAQLNTWSTPGQLQHFLHFEEFEIEIRLLGVDSHFNGLLMKDLIDLKTNLQKSKNFKTCSIYGEPKFTAEQFAEAIGTVIREDKTIRDPIPDSTDFMEFKFPFAYSRFIRITRKRK